MRRFSLVASAALTLCVAATSQAAVIFADPFTYPNGNLLGQGGWVSTGAANTTNPIQVTSNAAVMQTTGQDINSPFTSNFNHNDGDVLVTSLDMNVASAQSTGDYFLHLGITGNSSLFYERFYVKSSGSGYVLGITGTAGTIVYGTAVLPFSTSEHVDITWNVIAGTFNDTFDVAVNSSSYIAAAAWGSTTNGEPTAGLSSVNLRQGSATAAPAVTLDNLTVNYTAAAVPEPTTWAMMAPVGLLAVRRRRA